MEGGADDKAETTGEVATGQRLAEEIDDHVLQCSVCLDSLKDPKVLPCQHTFCKGCLEDILDAQEDKTSLDCPDCRRHVQLPETGVAGLTTNFLVNRLMDVLTKLRIAPEKCGICDEDEEESHAVARCSQCDVALCQLHYAAHRRSKATKKHSLSMIVPSMSGAFSTSSLPPSQPDTPRNPSTKGGTTEQSVTDVDGHSLPCARHDSHRAEKFCQNCEELVCSHCSADVHTTHRLLSVESAATSCQQTVDTLVDELSSQLQRAEVAISQLEVCCTEIDSEVKQAVSVVDNSFTDLLSVLEARRMQLLEEVQASGMARSKTLRLQREGLLFSVGNMRNALDNIKRLSSVGSSKDLLQVFKSVKKQLESSLGPDLELWPHATPGLVFDTDWQDVLLRHLEQFGRLDMSCVSPSQCVASGPGLIHAHCGTDAPIQITVVDPEGRPRDSYKDRVSVLLQSPSNLLAGARGGQTFAVSDAGNGTYTSTISCHEPGTHRLHISVNGWPIKGSPFTPQVSAGRDYTTLGEMKLEFGGRGSNEGRFESPRGVAIDRQGLLIISDMHNNRVQLFNSHGGFLRWFGGRGYALGKFSTPISVALDADGHIAVSDYGNHRIQVMRHNGEVVKSFGRKGTARGLFSLPFGLACLDHYKHGPCFVVTEFDNNRVQVVTADGEPVLMFGRNGSGPGQFLNPTGVALTKDKRIIVADHHNHRVQVFTEDGTFLTQFGQRGTNPGCFNNPCGVAVDLQGYVFVTDYNNHRVQVFTPDFTFLHAFGCEGSSPGQFSHPSGIAVDSAGTVYVTCDHRIQIF